MDETNQLSETATVESPEFQNIKDSGYRTVYSNQTLFGSTAFDFSMTFGEIVEVDADAKNIKVEQRVRVVMSPIHFKIFAAICRANVQGYEERFGEIKVPDGSINATTIPAKG